MPAVKTLVWIVCLGAVCHMPVRADVLVLRNDDRLTGEVIRKDGGVLTFDSSLAGRVDVKWSDVKELITEGPVTVVRVDGEVITAPLSVQNIPADALEENLESSVATNAFADIQQINPEPWELGEGWQFTGAFNLALKVEEGNNNKDEIDADAAITLRNRDHRFEFKGELEHDNNQNVQTKGKWVAQGKYDRFLGRKLFAVAYAMGEQDDFSDLELRTGGGPGVGYQLFDSDRQSLLIEVVGVRIYEEFRADPDEAYWGGGWGLDAERVLFRRGSEEVYFRHRGIWDLERTAKVFTKTWVGARVPLRGPVTGTLEVKHEYDRGAVATASEEDWTLRLKLGYRW